MEPLKKGMLMVDELDPHHLLKQVSGIPDISFSWKDLSKHGEKSKRRLVGNPNQPSRDLHDLFKKYILKV